MNLSGTKIPGELKTLSVSDIHLGHPNTQIEHIVGNLNTFVFNDSVLSSVDILNIPGDIFDSGFGFYEREVDVFHRFIDRALRKCAKHNVMVFVLLGTKSHDRGQGKFIATYNETALIGCDLIYADTLCIKHIDKYDMDVLFLPDEWKNDPDDTWRDITELLNEHGLTKVDYVNMHGLFRHQVPNIESIRVHDAERFRSICRRYIFNGHDHISSVVERIIVQGSFDRLIHGEEKPKGYFTVVDKGGDHAMDIITFVENTNAKIYHTIQAPGKTIEELIKFLDEYPELPNDSFVRLSVMKNDPIVYAFGAVTKRYSQYHWKLEKINTAVKATVTGITDLLRNGFIPITLTPQNIVEIIAPAINSRTDVPYDIKEMALDILKQVSSNEFTSP